MKIRVIASTKIGYVMPKEEAINFSGKSAGICYLPDTLETLFTRATRKNKIKELMVTLNLVIIVYLATQHITYALKEFLKYLLWF